MIERAVDDRRLKKQKIVNNQRKNKRRQEDLDNIKAYYSVLGLSIFIFILIGILSVIRGF